VSTPSCEEKLRLLAQQNAALVTALTFTIAPATPPQFLWMDRQLAQNALGVRSDNRTCVTVQRISTDSTRFGNMGNPVGNLQAMRLQLNVIDYNAERARQVASMVTAFMMSISLCWEGAFSSPQTAPSQNPNFLLNERGGMFYDVQPPAYVETQDWRVFNRSDIPS
jgi:hypothetical protein